MSGRELGRFWTRGVVKRCLVGLLLTSAISTGAAAQSSPPIKLGWLSSLTGPLSSPAIAENKGVVFAVSEINKNGGLLGRQIELITRDSTGDPTKAVNLAQQMIFNDRVDFLIGPINSGELLPAIPVIARANIPNIVIGAADGLTNASKYPLAFRVINTNTQWINAVQSYSFDVLKRRKVALIGDTTGYGTTTVQQATTALAKAGVKPVYSTLLDPNKTDLLDDLTKARDAGADVIMPWSASTGLLARLLNARADLKWDAPVVGPAMIGGAPIKNLLSDPKNWDNTFATGYRSVTYDENGKLPAPTTRLMELLKPEFGGTINFTFWWVALGYDTVGVIANAIKIAGSTDPKAFQKAMEETKQFKGVFGTYSWDPEVRDGLVDGEITMNKANSFRDGAFDAAPAAK